MKEDYVRTTYDVDSKLWQFGSGRQVATTEAYSILYYPERRIMKPRTRPIYVRVYIKT